MHPSASHTLKVDYSVGKVCLLAPEAFAEEFRRFRAQRNSALQQTIRDTELLAHAGNDQNNTILHRSSAHLSCLQIIARLRFPKNASLVLVSIAVGGKVVTCPTLMNRVLGQSWAPLFKIGLRF